jgi:hypothetical protein
LLRIIRTKDRKFTYGIDLESDQPWFESWFWLALGDFYKPFDPSGPLSLHLFQEEE